MAEKTTNYKLTKPAQDEYYDVDVFNGNADIIDTALADYDGRYKIGDIILTARTDLSDKWALCNGALIGDDYGDLQKVVNTQWTFPEKTGTFFCVLNGVYFKIDDDYNDGSSTYTGWTAYYTEKYENKATKWTKFEDGAFHCTGAFYINGKYVFTGFAAYSNSSSTSMKIFTKEAGAAPVAVSNGYTWPSGDSTYYAACNGKVLALSMTYSNNGSDVGGIKYTTDMDKFSTWKIFTPAQLSSVYDIYDFRYTGKYWCIFRKDGIYYSTDITANNISTIALTGYNPATGFVYLNGLYYLVAQSTTDKEFYLFYSEDPATIQNNKVKITLPAGITDHRDAPASTDNGGYTYRFVLIPSTDTGRLYLTVPAKGSYSVTFHIIESPAKYSKSSLPKAATWNLKTSGLSLYASYVTHLPTAFITEKQTNLGVTMSYLPELPTISPDHSYAYIKRED